MNESDGNKDKTSGSSSAKLGNIRLSLGSTNNSSGAANKTSNENKGNANETSKPSGSSLPTIRLSSKSAKDKKSTSPVLSKQQSSHSPSIKLSASNLIRKSGSNTTTTNSSSSDKNQPNKSSATNRTPSSQSTNKSKKVPTFRFNLTPPSDGNNSSNLNNGSSGGSSGGGSNNNPKNSSESAKKKIKFSTSAKRGKISRSASHHTQIWHQRTNLSFLYYKKKDIQHNLTSETESFNKAASQHIWGYEGTTTMYITQEDNDRKRNKNSGGNSSSKNVDASLFDQLELGIHLRGGCVVTEIQAYYMDISPGSAVDKSDEDSKGNIDIKNQTEKCESKDRNEQNQEKVPPKKGVEEEEGKLQEQTVLNPKKQKESLNTPIKKEWNDPEQNLNSRSVSPDHDVVKEDSATPSLVQHELPRAKLTPLKVSYDHFDPLAKVFCASSKWMKKDFEEHIQRSKKENDTDGKENAKRDHNSSTSLKYEGDDYCQFGGKRMMRSLRAASASSTLGELRVIVSKQIQNKHKKVKIEKTNRELAEHCWKYDLLEGDKNENEYGEVLTILNKKAFMERSSYLRKMKRIDYISKQLALHSFPSKELKTDKKKDSSQKKNPSNSNALKLVIRFNIPDPSILQSSCGIHFMTPSMSHLSSGSYAPYVYTTCGTFGDHQGPRCWLPCLDSSSSKHRCTHEMAIKVTSKREEGITVVGCGEDFGQIDTVIRSHASSDSSRLYGTRHHVFLNDMKKYHTKQEPFALFATSIFYTSVFTPMPARSLGFAIGPFLSCPDPEYQNDIRQIYLAPLSLRSFLHSSQPVSTPKSLRNSVIAGTSGVPLRALSLTREILALPTFRSSTYTQVWLPACVDGGSSSGMWHQCHSANSWLGGATIDSNLLPPPGYRLPFHAGGRVLQMVQARCAINGWVVSSLPLGGDDDVGQGYIHTLICTQLMEIYERAHGGSGEGGGKTSHFYVERFAVGSGLNGCSFLDFLPVQNVEEDEMMGGLGSGLAVEEKKNEELWRGALNGTESRTSAMEEISIRKTLTSDILEYLERNDDSVPLPSPDWQGSHLSLTFLSSNSSSSSYVGSGATDLLHPVGGLSFRTLKCEALSQAISARAGLANFIRFMRACFIATMLIDAGEANLVIPDLNPPVKKTPKKSESSQKASKNTDDEKKTKEEESRPRLRPPFVLCVDEIIKKNGITHTLVTSCLRRLAGPIREPYLYGHSHWSLIDISTDITDQNNRPLVEPEGFPNSYIRGTSNLYLRVGAHVEAAGSDGLQAGAQSSANLVKGIHLHIFSEPIIPKGGISFAGPVTVRVVENEGQCCEYERKLTGDGRREGWGPIPLHAKTVTTAKQQNAASGGLDGTGKDGGKRKGCFNKDLLHVGGYQALELIRLTNRSPLLWVRVDPHNQYPGARIHISQPDACLAEQLFHDGDGAGQLIALRALAERPTRIQGSVKISNIFDARVHEMPVRVLGDCLRGSVALHCSLPHTPAVRAQAALAIAQWQNNKAPASKDAVGVDAWLGLDILFQYFKERHMHNGQILPVRYTRRSVKEVDAKTSSSGKNDGGPQDNYQYLDAYNESHRAEVLEEAEDIAEEEDEEYRVRSAAITAIASIRAKDGQTPPSVLRFLESILVSHEGATLENISSIKEGMPLPSSKRLKRAENNDFAESDDDNEDFIVERQIKECPYVSSHIIADALLALCQINCRPAVIEDSKGVAVQVNGAHPILPLMEACHRWLEWELYKESIRLESEENYLSNVGGNCYVSTAACGITALSQLAILRNCTTNVTNFRASESTKEDSEEDTFLTGDSTSATKRKGGTKLSGQASNSQFYINIFDAIPKRSDTIRAAAAQAVVCICCAADRLKKKKSETFGLLTALNFLLDRILDPSVSSGLKQSLAAIMIDVCSGTVCSMPRIAVVGGQNDLVPSVSRLVCGPLGAGYGGDNGSALLMTITENTYPAAHSVNHGALEGLRLLKQAGKDEHTHSEEAVIQVAQFAAKLWRTMNGEMGAKSSEILAKENDESIYATATGVCAFNGHLRVALLSFWQKLWPRECYAIHQVQKWRENRNLTIPGVLEMDRSRIEDIREEEKELDDINKVVESELGRQRWRGEMASRAYNYWLQDGKRGMKDISGSASQGLGHPLPIVEKDKAWKMGGWSASSAQQRRKMALDGGTAVNKIRAFVQK